MESKYRLLDIIRRHNKEIDDICKDWERSQEDKMITIKVKGWMDGEHQERFEDAIWKCLADFGVEGEIHNTDTGNDITVNKEVPKL